MCAGWLKGLWVAAGWFMVMESSVEKSQLRFPRSPNRDIFNLQNYAWHANNTGPLPCETSAKNTHSRFQNLRQAPSWPKRNIFRTKSLIRIHFVITDSTRIKVAYRPTRPTSTYASLSSPQQPPTPPFPAHQNVQACEKQACCRLAVWIFEGACCGLEGKG